MSPSNSVVLLNGKYFLNLNITTKTQFLHSPYGHYNSYQEELYNLCTKLKKEGLGYNKISQLLNEKGLKTPFSKSSFKGNNVESLIRKGKVREKRIKKMKSHKEYGYEFETYLTK